MKMKNTHEMASFKQVKNNVDAKIVFRVHIDHTQRLDFRRRYSNLVA
jgi:hypothetical protein